jgi:hypothetical protein
LKRENKIQDWLKHHNIPLEYMIIGNLVMRTSLSHTLTQEASSLVNGNSRRINVSVQ